MCHDACAMCAYTAYPCAELPPIIAGVCRDHPYVEDMAEVLLEDPRWNGFPLLALACAGAAATVGRAVTTLELQVMLFEEAGVPVRLEFRRAESLTTAVQALLLAQRASDWRDSALALAAKGLEHVVAEGQKVLSLFSEATRAGLASLQEVAAEAKGTAEQLTKEGTSPAAVTLYQTYRSFKKLTAWQGDVVGELSRLANGALVGDVKAWRGQSAEVAGHMIAVRDTLGWCTVVQGLHRKLNEQETRLMVLNRVKRVVDEEGMVLSEEIRALLLAGLAEHEAEAEDLE